MKQRNLLLLLLVAALVPYVVICFYAFPFADDFCFGWTASEPISFGQKFLNQYLYWNGRYTADVLVNVHPLITGSLLLYQMTLLISMLATPLVVYWATIQILGNRFRSLAFALFFSLIYLCYMPNVTEGVYWYIGIVNYHLGNLIALLQICVLLVALSKGKMLRRSLLFISTLLLIAAIGFNEIAAVAIPVGYLFMAVYSFYRKTEQRKIWAWFAFIAMVSACLVFFAPGNALRAAQFPERYQLVHSIVFASLQTIRFLAQWILNYPALALSLVLLLWAKQISTQLRVPVSWKPAMLFGIFVLFMASFLPYFATGALGQHRTINYAFFYFLLWYPYALIRFAAGNPFFQQLRLEYKKTLTIVLLFTSVIVLAFSGNGLLMVKDFYHERFENYKQEFETRATRIQSDSAVIAPLQNIPQVFRVVDAKDSAFWVNRCMYHYYSQRCKQKLLHQ